MMGHATCLASKSLLCPGRQSWWQIAQHCFDMFKHGGNSQLSAAVSTWPILCTLYTGRQLSVSMVVEVLKRAGYFFCELYVNT